MRNIRIVVAALVLGIAIVPLLRGQAAGVKKRRPRPDEFGNVLMNNVSEKNGMAPVVFSHWLHRSRFSCRLCHVDIGFAMQANGTGVREEDNRKGFYCGACHNGRIAFSVQNEQTPASSRECDRCHSVGKNIAPHVEFAPFTATLPKGRFGNNVDWEAAEIDGKIHLTDTLPEISVKRKPLNVPQDYSIEAKMAGLPEIIFSHKKHAAWNGCELCHPDIYAVKAGTTKYTMQDVFAGKYCGLCHGSVAFPTTDCQRCHVKPVA